MLGAIVNFAPASISTARVTGLDIGVRIKTATLCVEQSSPELPRKRRNAVRTEGWLEMLAIELRIADYKFEIGDLDLRLE